MRIHRIDANEWKGARDVVLSDQGVATRPQIHLADHYIRMQLLLLVFSFSSANFNSTRLAYF